MLTKAHWLFLVLLLIGNTLTAQEKFVSEPGTIFLGGSLGINYSQDFGEKSVSLFSAALHPLFGEFLTRQIMLFTHFGFSIQNYAIGPGGVFDYPAWSGSISIGAQARYFFSTQETLNIFLGLELSLGLNISEDYSRLGEHVLVGPVAGFFIPFNSKIGLDLSLSPLFYYPLNNYQQMMMVVVTSVGIISSL